MKKLLLFSTIAFTTGMMACKEKGPAINFGESNTLTDTTYTKTPDAPVGRKVLVEEFTGAKCTNCPDARVQLKTIADAHPGKVIVMELHPADHPLGHPIEGLSKYNFNVQDVSDIFKTIFRGYFPLGIPAAGIDRTIDGSDIIIKRASWSNIINTRVAETSPVKLTLTNTYDAAKASGIIKINASYTKQITTKNYISIAIIEDNIVDAQEFLDHVDTFYNFQHVMRKLYTPASGTEILSTIATKEPGRVYEGSFKYTIDPAWKPENCRIVVWIHNNDANTKEVLQAEEVDVKNQ